MDCIRTVLFLLSTTALVVVGACSDGSMPDAPGDDDTLADPEASPCDAGYRLDPDLPAEFLDDFPDGCVPQECGIGRWGNLEVDEEVVYVDAYAAEDGDGTMDAPFTSIQDGLDATAEADCRLVAVAAGIYVENLLLRRNHDGVRLAGRCRELVVVDASGGEEDEPGILAEGFTGDEEWRVSGITMTGAPNGGVGLVKGSFHATSVSLLQNQGVGLLAMGESSEMLLANVEVRDTQPSPDGAFGRGINVQDGASLVAEDCLLEGNADVGIYVAHESVTVYLSNVEVRETQPNADGTSGRGIDVNQGASLDAEGCRIEGNAEVGIIVSDGDTTVHLLDVAVRETYPEANGTGGTGIAVLNEAFLEAEGCLVEGNSGNGIEVYQGASLDAEDCRVEGNAGVGITVADEDSTALLSNVEVREVLKEAVGGRGIEVYQGASLDAKDCLVVGATEVGLLVGQAGTTARLSNVEIRDTRPLADGTDGIGISVQDEASLWVEASMVSGNADKGISVVGGASLQAENCTVERNTSIGINVNGGGTAVRLSNVEVHETTPRADGAYGRGLNVSDEASIQADGCRVEGNADVGVFVSTSATALLSSVVVRETRPSADGTGGRGIEAQDGAFVQAQDCLVEGNADVGVFTSDEGTEVVLSNVEVRETQPDGDGIFGRGIGVQSGASLLAEDCLVQRNADVGISVMQAGTMAHLSNVEVSDTRPVVGGSGGWGIGVQDGASLHAEGCRIVRNGDLGIFASENSTMVFLSNVTVEEVQRSSFDVTVAQGMTSQAGAVLVASNVAVNQIEGPGLLSTTQGTLRCSGCDLTDNAFAGALVWAGGILELSDTTISGTVPDANEGGGLGVYSSDREALVQPTTLLIESTTIQDQPYATVWLDGDGSYTIRNSTLVAGYGMELEYPDGTTTLQHGDAVVAMDGVSSWDGANGLLLENNEIRNAVRAGLLLDASSATLSNNSFTGNNTDLIWQGCDGVGEPDGIDDVATVDYCPTYNHHIAPLEFNLYLEEVEPLE